MTREQAIAVLRRLYGERYYYRVGKPSDPDQREAALADLKAIKADEAALEQAIALKLKAFWDTPEMQQHAATRTRLKKAREAASEAAHHYKFTVGYVHEIGDLKFAHLSGTGDTWEEALDKARKEKGGRS